MRARLSALLVLLASGSAYAQTTSRLPETQWLVIGGQTYAVVSAHGGGMRDSAGAFTPRTIRIALTEGDPSGVDSLFINSFFRGDKLSGRLVVVDFARQNEVVQTEFSNATVSALELTDYDAASKNECSLIAELTPRTSKITMVKTPIGSNQPSGLESKCRVLNGNVKLGSSLLESVPQLSGLRIEHAPTRLKARVTTGYGDHIFSWYNSAVQQGLGSADQSTLEYALQTPNGPVGVWTADSVSILTLDRIPNYWEAELSARGWHYTHYAKTQQGSPSTATPVANGGAQPSTTEPSTQPGSEFRATVGGNLIRIRGQAYCANNGPLVLTAKADGWLLTIMAASARVGTYRLGGESDFNLTIADQRQGLTVYEAVNGTVTLTAATPEHVVGSFKYKAEVKDSSGDEHGEQPISGTFDLRGRTCE